MHAARNRLRNSPGIYGHLSPDWRPEPPRAFTIRRTATSAWRQSHPDLQLLHRRLRQCRQGLRCTPPEKREGTPQPLRRSLADYRCGLATARLADGAGWILSREVAGRGFHRRAGEIRGQQLLGRESILRRPPAEPSRAHTGNPPSYVVEVAEFLLFSLEECN